MVTIQQNTPIHRKRIMNLKTSTLFSAICIIICTLIAISSIPINYSKSGALFWPALIMTAGILIFIPMRIGGGLISLLRTENILMLGVIYWVLLDLLQSAYPLPGIKLEEFELAFICIGIFTVSIWLGTLGRSWPLPNLIVKSAKINLNNKMVFIACVIAFVLGMTNYVITSHFDPLVMWNGVTNSRWKAPWSRGQFGGWDSFAHHLQYFGYVLPSLTVTLACRKGWLNPLVIFCIFLSFIILMFLSQGGGRRIVGVTIGAALICWTLLQPHLRFKQIIGILFIVVITLTLMQGMLKYRNVGYQALLKDEPEKRLIQYSHLHVDDNFLRLTQIVKIFPQGHQYVYFEPVVFALVRPVPRAFWQGKPIDPGYDLPSLIGRSGKTSLSQSIIGELYACYGLIAVFLGGWFLGRIASMWNRILDYSYGNSKPLFYGLGVMTMFTAIRSMQDLIIMSYGVLGWIVISAYLLPKYKNNISI